MKKTPKNTGQKHIQAMRENRYTYFQIKHACDHHGGYSVSEPTLCAIAKGSRPASQELLNALVLACKGLRVKV